MSDADLEKSTDCRVREIARMLNVVGCTDGALKNRVASWVSQAIDDYLFARDVRNRNWNTLHRVQTTRQRSAVFDSYKTSEIERRLIELESDLKKIELECEEEVKHRKDVEKELLGILIKTEVDQ